jgi:hypothetical protein
MMANLSLQQPGPPLPPKKSLLGKRAQQRPNGLGLVLINDVDRVVTEHVTTRLAQATRVHDRCVQRVVTRVPDLLVLYRVPDCSVTILGDDLVLAVVGRRANGPLLV